MSFYGMTIYFEFINIIFDNDISMCLQIYKFANILSNKSTSVLNVRQLKIVIGNVRPF